LLDSLSATRGQFLPQLGRYFQGFRGNGLAGPLSFLSLVADIEALPFKGGHITP